VLADIAKTSKESNVRQAAVELVTDQAVLGDIARNAEEGWVRTAALKRLTDQRVFADLAKDGKEYAVRMGALNCVADDDLLADIAKHAEEADVRAAAVERVTDQRLLKDVAKSDKEWAVRKAAVNRMHDNVMLAEIAENDKDPNVSQAAVERITDQSVLAHLATASDYIDSETCYRYPRDVRKVAAAHITDQRVLASIAKYDKEANVFDAAVDHLTDEVALGEISEHHFQHHDPWRGDSARRRLSVLAQDRWLQLLMLIKKGDFDVVKSRLAGTDKSDMSILELLVADLREGEALREETVAVLGLCQDRGAIEPLSKLVQEDRPYGKNPYRVFPTACEALANMNDPLAAKPLIAAVHRPICAEYALGLLEKMVEDMPARLSAEVLNELASLDGLYTEAEFNGTIGKSMGVFERPGTRPLRIYATSIAFAQRAWAAFAGVPGRSWLPMAPDAPR
jgi:hypothetical protein